MKLKRYQAYVHENTETEPLHVDVELTFQGHPTIKMCDCSAYLGGVDTFGSVGEMAAQLREDLNAMANDGTSYTVKRDKLDGSIDVFRDSDGALMFSMECEHIEGADWVPEYDSTEG